METKGVLGTERAGLGISIAEEHRGLKDLDFFADHVTTIPGMRYMPDNVSMEMGTLYLRTALTNITCPLCKKPVKRNIKNPPLEWLLKFSGRKVLYCTGCNWKKIVKEHGWQWENLTAAIAALLIICFASVYWILR